MVVVESLFLFFEGCVFMVVESLFCESVFDGF